MRMPRRILAVSAAMWMLTGWTGFALSQGVTSIAGGVVLDEQQAEKLGTIVDEFYLKKLEIQSRIHEKVDELDQEIREEGRFETKIKEKLSVRRANKLVREITSLYGDLLNTRVAYFLKARDVLTPAQREQILHTIALEGDTIQFEKELPGIFDLDFLAVPIHLSNDQIKAILAHKTDSEIQSLKIGLKVTYQLMDLQAALSAPEPDTKEVDKIVLKIVDLWKDRMDGKVECFLKSKDELTTEQRSKLIHTLLM